MPAFQGQRNKNPWYLEGKKVKGVYLDEYVCAGTVLESRVCYGGAVKHLVELDEPIYVNFSSGEDAKRTKVYLIENQKEDENELMEIY